MLQSGQGRGRPLMDTRQLVFAAGEAQELVPEVHEVTAGRAFFV